MGALDEFFGIVNKQAQESDYYSPFASSLLQLPANISTSGLREGSRQNIGADTAFSFGKALLAGLLQNQGQQEQQAVRNAAPNILSQILKTGSADKPEGLSDSQFGDISNAASIFKTQRDYERSDLVDKLRLTDPVKAIQNEILFGASDSPEGNPDAKSAIKSRLDELFTKYGGDEQRMTADKKRQDEANTPDPISVPAATIAELSKSKGVIDEARQIANVLGTGATSWVELQQSKAFSGLDEEGIGLSLKNLADKLSRARSGAALNTSEIKLYNQLVGGDLTASPAQVSALLKKLADAESRTAQSQLDFLEAGRTGIAGLKQSLGSSSSAPSITSSSSVPPGMKLQRNKLTGETRIVPQ